MIFRHHIYHFQQSFFYKSRGWNMNSKLVGVRVSISQKFPLRVRPPFAARNARQRRLVLLMSRPVMGCSGDPAPLRLEFVSELLDILWLVRPSPDTCPARRSHKGSTRDQS